MIVVKDNDIRRHFHSQLISLAEVKSKKPYISIKLRIATDKPNLNDEGITQAFIRDIVENKEDYIGLPLYADTTKIRKGDYLQGLGHMFDSENNVFHTEQIGSFHGFEIEEIGEEVSLVGESRIYKRDRKIAEAIVKCYEANALNFSFEIEAGEPKMENGVLWVDKSPLNKLVGMAIVSRPAYPNANTLALVAEQKQTFNAETLQHTYVTLAEAVTAEASLETIGQWIYEAVYKFIEENIGYFAFTFYQIGIDSATLYNVKTGRLFIVEYVIRESDVFVTDIYPAKLVRESVYSEVNHNTVEREERKMELKEVAAEVVAETEVVADAAVVAEVTPEVEEVKEDVENVNAQAIGTPEIVDDIKDQHITIDNVSPEQPITTAEVDELKARIAELEEVEKKWLASEEAVRLAAVSAKKEKLTNYAKASGLDLKAEIVASAVEAMDYEKLVSLVLEAQVTEPEVEKEQVTASDKIINPLMSDMKLSGNWLFEKTAK